MVGAFTCPHCDAALELPPATPTQAVLCPCCEGLLPNPAHEVQAAAEGRPLLARVVDEDALRSPDSKEIGCIAGLGAIGVLAAAVLFWSFIEVFAGSTPIGGLTALAVGLVAAISLYIFGYLLALQRRRPASFIGQAILILFAGLGGVSLLLGASLLALVVLFVVLRGFA